MTTSLPIRRRKHAGASEPEPFGQVAWEALKELARQILNFILKLFGLPLIAAQKVGRALGFGSNRGGAHDAAAEAAHRAREFEMSTPAPKASSDAPDPTRLVPAMKAYLQAATPHQRQEIAARLRDEQILAYLEGLRPVERDAFLLASPSALRRHFDGTVVHARLPAWSREFDYRSLQAAKPERISSPKPANAIRPPSKPAPLVAALSSGGLQERTRQMMADRRPAGI
ncbi:MAG: hypothetical protein ACU0BO_11105 [Limimaricola soesokkakensis]|uniref:hypothetical protein n=1 Tax=Limimaricola soesokkakensis TaxID=1343159 RepID=UPI00405998B8